MLVFDAETDGFLETVSKVHCLNLIDRTTKVRERYSDHDVYDDGSPTLRTGTIQDALERLRRAPEIGGQNVIKYDLPVLEKLFGFRYTGKVRDTRVEASVIWTNLTDIDFGLLRAGKLPQEFQKSGLIGRNSLEAWGYRLGLHKGDFNPKDYGHTWETVPFMREMDDYCEQDCVVTCAWFDKIDAKGYSVECLDLETRVALIIAQQERNGFAFDVHAAEKLQGELMKQRVELEQELREVFPPWKVLVKREISKVNNKKLGRVKGEVYEVWKDVVFNPGSRDHIADRLIKLRGWTPAEFTPNGKPQVDEEILSALPYPEAAKLTEYLTVVKRLGQLSDGKNGWLRCVRNGRIHGTVNTNGAVTGRMTHNSPNVAQADKWAPMRALWYVPEGRVLVGCDAEGLELRMLGHYMARWDGGAYADAVVNGKKEDETDVHSVNKNAVGLNKRDSAKTFIYALIYGAGDYKLGCVVYDDFTEEQKVRFNSRPATLQSRDRALATLGKNRKQRLMDRLPALAKFTEEVKKAAKARGYLRGLDGRLLHVRSEHAAPNTLLQSGGAVVMKKALVLLDDQLQAHTAERMRDTLFVANVHDEFQMEAYPQHATELGTLAADAIRRAGEHFSLRCPLAGSFDIGANWAETH